MPEPSEVPEYGRTAENGGASPAYPDTDPNAATRSFDAFTPAPPASSEATWIGPPDGSGGVGNAGGVGGAGGGYPPADPPYFAYPPEPDPVLPVQAKHSRTRSVAIIAAIVLVVCGIGAGAYAALDSTSTPNQPTAAATAPAAGTTAGTAAGTTKGTRKARKLQTAKVTITSFNGQTLSGTTASGVAITVDITSATKFGTAARPLTASELAVGDVVVVRGTRVGTGTYDATLIAMAPDAASGGTDSGTPGPTPSPTPTGPSA